MTEARTMHSWNYVRSYYDTNRSIREWDMTRRAALWSAWKCWRMVRPHVKEDRKTAS